MSAIIACDHAILYSISLYYGLEKGKYLNNSKYLCSETFYLYYNNKLWCCCAYSLHVHDVLLILWISLHWLNECRPSLLVLCADICNILNLFKKKIVTLLQKLGFASCERQLGATEGINVLIEKNNLDGRWTYGLSCIEYTEFDKFGITNGPLSPER